MDVAKHHQHSTAPPVVQMFQLSLYTRVSVVYQITT